MLLPAPHERIVPVAVTMVNAPDLSLRGPNGAVAISGKHLQFVQSNDKTYQPIASVAALTAQPLAALPPYGCGVPFTGSERPASWQCLQRKFIDATPSGLSLRGGRRPTWQSRGGTADLYRLPGKRTRLVGERHASPGAALAVRTGRRENSMHRLRL